MYRDVRDTPSISFGSPSKTIDVSANTLSKKSIKMRAEQENKVTRFVHKIKNQTQPFLKQKTK